MASWYSLLAWYWFARLNNTCSDTYEESGTSSIHDVVQMSTLWVHTCVHYSTCMVKVCQLGYCMCTLHCQIWDVTYNGAYEPNWIHMYHYYRRMV